MAPRQNTTSVVSSEDEQDGILKIRLQGDVTLDQARSLHDRLRRSSKKRRIQGAEIDLSDVGKLDSASAAVLKLATRRLQDAGKRGDLTGCSEQHEAALGLIRLDAARPSAAGSRTTVRSLLVGVGGFALQAWEGIQNLAELVVDTVVSSWSLIVHGEKRRVEATVEQSVLVGVDAILIVGLLSYLIGIVIAFQGIHQLQFYGAEFMAPELVVISLVREFSPLITAIIFAGRSGAAIAAEIGTMVVREETDALRAIGVSPVSFLVLPRVVGLTVIGPLMTLMSMAIGMAGGITISGFMGQPAGVVYHRMQVALSLGDLSQGLLKSVLFALVIAFTGCFMGLRTKGGARSVGANTTRAVVTSIFLIVVVDSIVTTLWTVANG